MTEITPEQRTTGTCESCEPCMQKSGKVAVRMQLRLASGDVVFSYYAPYVSHGHHRKMIETNRLPVRSATLHEAVGRKFDIDVRHLISGDKIYVSVSLLGGAP